MDRRLNAISFLSHMLSFKSVILYGFEIEFIMDCVCPRRNRRKAVTDFCRRDERTSRLDRIVDKILGNSNREDLYEDSSSSGDTRLHKKL